MNEQIFQQRFLFVGKGDGQGMYHRVIMVSDEYGEKEVITSTLLDHPVSIGFSWLGSLDDFKQNFRVAV